MRKIKREEKDSCMKEKEKGSNSRCSDGQKLLVRELKLVYSTRAMSR